MYPEFSMTHREKKTTSKNYPYSNKRATFGLNFDWMEF